MATLDKSRLTFTYYGYYLGTNLQLYLKKLLLWSD